VLDEVEKMGADVRGDPTAALLEVLDPEQNGTFQDHYLDLPFDLSQVTFLATANDRDAIPGPLLDRMEVIDVPGYTRNDKLGIAKEFLIPKQLSAHGLTDERLEFTPDGIAAIVDNYTREAGVRGLEREIAAVCRATAVKLAEGQDVREVVDVEHVQRCLGPFRVPPRQRRARLDPGVSTGLSTSAGGGDILFIEASKMPGRGQVVLTGNMRNVMQESATTAVSFVRSKAESLGLDPEWLRELDLHIHVPKHGTPKDGPSAGVTMFVAVCSLLLGCPVRGDVAMTGEITLRGKGSPSRRHQAEAARRSPSRHPPRAHPTAQPA
jgi:ATP-dependent Lon protease